MALSDGKTLAQLLGVQCYSCLDTSVEITLYGPKSCSECAGQARRLNPLKPSAERLAGFIWSRIGRKQEVDLLPLNVARILVHTSAQSPLSGPELQEHLQLSERNVKAVIEKLRRDWQLPIGSTRQSGYYWMHTTKDFLDWSRAYRSQAITSLVTLYKMQRSNFGELAGQEPLQFIEQIEDEMREAIR